jgi:hypothetical protein
MELLKAYKLISAGAWSSVRWSELGPTRKSKEHLFETVEHVMPERCPPLSQVYVTYDSIQATSALTTVHKLKF